VSGWTLSTELEPGVQEILLGEQSRGVRLGDNTAGDSKQLLGSHAAHGKTSGQSKLIGPREDSAVLRMDTGEDREEGNLRTAGHGGHGFDGALASIRSHDSYVPLGPAAAGVLPPLPGEEFLWVAARSHGEAPPDREAFGPPPAAFTPFIHAWTLALFALVWALTEPPGQDQEERPLP
jgi:hypothetical protein